MPGFLLNQNNTFVNCFHGAPVFDTVPSNSKVLINSQPVQTVSDLFNVVGCLFNISGAPNPCTTVKWINPSKKILINQIPPLLNTSIGMGQDATFKPQGICLIVQTQLKVMGE